MEGLFYEIDFYIVRIDMYFIWNFDEYRIIFIIKVRFEVEINRWNFLILKFC